MGKNRVEKRGEWLGRENPETDSGCAKFCARATVCFHFVPKYFPAKRFPGKLLLSRTLPLYASRFLGLSCCHPVAVEKLSLSQSWLISSPNLCHPVWKSSLSLPPSALPFASLYIAASLRLSGFLSHVVSHWIILPLCVWGNGNENQSRKKVIILSGGKYQKGISGSVWKVVYYSGSP